MALGATAVVGGFVEAAVMVIIVRIAVALASGDDTVSVHLGPIATAPTAFSQLFRIFPAARKRPRGVT